MAYFPDRIMPDIQKKDVAGATTDDERIVASDWNKHNDEIIAIEEFLGVGSASAADVTAIVNGSTDPKNIIGVIERLIDEMNLFSDEGILTTSGYVHNGQKMIFPEQAHVAFLTDIPSTSDSVIRVASTLGFPESGVLTILNDIAVPTQSIPKTMVEWIKYTSKTSTEFLGCTRGFGDSTIGAHSGAPALTATFSGDKNLLDACVSPPAISNVCDRRYRGHRLKNIHSFAPFGLTGSILEITRAVRRDPELFDLTEDYLQNSFEAIIEAAEDAGILATRDDGKSILMSADAAYQANNELSWEEAAEFIDALADENIVTLVTKPEDRVVGKRPFIPVFAGRMSVQHSVAALTLNPEGNPIAPTTLQAASIVQSADGRVFIEVVSDSASQNTVDQAVVNYKVFFVASPRTSLERSLG